MWCSVMSSYQITEVKQHWTQLVLVQVSSWTGNNEYYKIYNMIII